MLGFLIWNDNEEFDSNLTDRPCAHFRLLLVCPVLTYSWMPSIKAIFSIEHFLLCVGEIYIFEIWK